MNLIKHFIQWFRQRNCRHEYIPIGHVVVGDWHPVMRLTCLGVMAGGQRDVRVTMHCRACGKKGIIPGTENCGELGLFYTRIETEDVSSLK